MGVIVYRPININHRYASKIAVGLFDYFIVSFLTLGNIFFGELNTVSLKINFSHMAEGAGWGRVDNDTHALIISTLKQILNKVFHAPEVRLVFGSVRQV